MVVIGIGIGRCGALVYMGTKGGLGLVFEERGFPWSRNMKLCVGWRRWG
jgi:hypothetical protein